MASVLLPLRWRELGETSSEGWFRMRSKGRAKSVGAIPFKGGKWSEKPLLWLAVRDISLRKTNWFIGVMFFILIANTLAIYFLETNPGNSSTFSEVDDLFGISVFTSYGLHFLGKIILVSESSRRMNSDRRTGGWELILVTPVKLEEILSGQFHALKNRFSVIFTMLIFTNLLLLIQVYLYKEMFTEDRQAFVGIFIGGWIALWLDFNSLSWLGMWKGVKCVKQHTAVILTLLQIAAPGWLIFFLLAFIRPNARSPIPWVVGWFFITSMISAISGIHAK